MIKHPFKYKLRDLTVDFNWNQQVTPCKEVRITLGKKRITLSRGEFTCLMAVFADDKQMEDIIQHEKRQFISVQRMLKIKTNKDLKAGDSVVFPYTYWIPKEEYNELKNSGEMIKKIEESKKELIDYIADNEAGKQVKQMMLEGKLPVDDIKLVEIK
jgi:hypothetical protein